MELLPSAKIYKMIRELKIVAHKNRQEFLVDMVMSLIKCRSVLFYEIAESMDKSVKTSSVERRIQDFFQKVDINYSQLVLFLLSFIHHEKMVLSIDRTEWDYGKTQVNILCVVASIGKMAVPLYFEMLDNNSGNSGAPERISLFESLLEKIGVERIEMLVMDREFVGMNWLKWLKAQEIPFCVRVPKNHKVSLKDGGCFYVEELLQEDKSRCITGAIVDRVFVNVSLSYGKNGELLYLVGTVAASELKRWYKRRWGIEVFFQALKSRGFDMEKSCLKDIQKYRKLFAIASIAYTLCWATGIENGKTNPVKPKKHGYPQFSVFRRGLNLLRQFFKQKIIQPLDRAINRAIIFLQNMNYKIIG